MGDRFRLTLAQLNPPTVGDIEAMPHWRAGPGKRRARRGADMVALPEMFITGYNTQDLVMKPVFHQAAIAAVEALAKDCADGPALGIGGPALNGGVAAQCLLYLQRW